MPSQNKNLQLIQLLRGIAALLVVLLHTTINANEIFNSDFLFNFFKFGGAGVDTFFVLSGFVITYTSQKNIGYADKLPSFIKRRCVRIYPTYWIIISLFLLSQILLPAFYRTHFSFSLTNIFSTYLLFPGHGMVNGVSWTLSYELFFYLLFCFAFIIKNKKNSFGLAISYAAAVILLPLGGYNYNNESPWLSLITSPMNVEFLMGVTVVVLLPCISKKISIPFICLGSIIFLLDGILTNMHYTLFPNSFNRVVFFGVPSFFIITGLVKYELSHSVKPYKIFLLLGESSYSLYLIHLPLIVASFKVIAKLNMQDKTLLHNIPILIIGIICLISIKFYKFVEKPIIIRLNSLRGIKVTNEI